MSSERTIGATRRRLSSRYHPRPNAYFYAGIQLAAVPRTEGLRSGTRRAVDGKSQRAEVEVPTGVSSLN